MTQLTEFPNKSNQVAVSDFPFAGTAGNVPQPSARLRYSGKRRAPVLSNVSAPGATNTSGGIGIVGQTPRSRGGRGGGHAPCAGAFAPHWQNEFPFICTWQ